MKINLVDPDPSTRSYSYQKLLEIVNSSKLPFTVRSSSPDNIEKDAQIVVIGQTMVRKHAAQINQLKKMFPKTVFIAYTPDYKLSAGFVEKLALVGVEEIFDADSTESEIKKRLIFVLHRVRQSQGSGGLIVMTGVKGGSGNTTLAISLGESLNLRGLSVCVIDFDLEFQNLSRFLLAKNPYSLELADCLLMNRALTFEILMSATYELTSDGSFCLLLPPSLGFEEVSARESWTQTYLDALGLLSSKFDALVLDLPAHTPMGLRCSLVGVADAVVLTVNPEPVSLLNLVSAVSKFRSKLNYSAHVALCCNRYIDGKIPEKILKTEAETSLGSPCALASVPSCGKVRYWPGSGKTALGVASKAFCSAMAALSEDMAKALSLNSRLQSIQAGSSIEPLALPKVSSDN